MEESRFTFSERAFPNSSLILDRIYKVNADESYDVHQDGSEPGYAVFRTLKGRGRIILRSGSVEEQREDSLIVTRWERVARYYCSEPSWEFLWFKFRTDDRLLLPLEQTVALPSTGEDSRIIEDCLELGAVPYDEAGALTSALISTLLHRWALERIRSLSPRCGHRKEVDRIIAAMKKDLTKKLTIPEMAVQAGLSERRLRTVFKDETGLSPVRYYEDLRMKAALDLIRFTPLSVKEIAARLGYCDQFHFSRVFKGFYGYSPGKR